MKTLICAVFLIFSLGTAGGTAHAESSAEALSLLRKVDELYRSDSSQAELMMKIDTPDWSREMRIQSWSKGMKKTLIRVLAPKKDRGVATLRVDREMWNFFPKINQVIKVPPSMMMGSWMGSDFTNDDLVRETSLVEEYNVTMKTQGDQHLLTLIPKATTATVWGKIEVTVDKKSMLPEEQTFYDEKGKKVRLMRFKDVKDFGGRKLPAVMELIPLTKEGHKTTMTYEKLKFDTSISDGFFSLRSLQERI